MDIMVFPPLKHVVDDLLLIPAATVATQIITLAVGTINPNYTSSNTNVRNGSKVTRLNLMLDIAPTFGADVDAFVLYDWYIAFNIAGAQSLPAPNAVGNSDYLTQVFHQDQGVFQLIPTVNPATGISNSHVIRLTLDIPKAWQVVNKDDTIEFHIIKSVMGNVAANSGLQVKLKCIYKEIFP